MQYFIFFGGFLLGAAATLALLGFCLLPRLEQLTKLERMNQALLAALQQEQADLALRLLGLSPVPPPIPAPQKPGGHLVTADGIERRF